MSVIGSFLKGVGRAVSGVVGSVPVVGSFLSSGLDSILNDMDAQDQSNAQIAQSKALMNYQNDLNVKNWTMQNEYNTPAAQLQRLQDAGLNPLAYGLDGNSSGNVPQVAGQSAPDRASLLNYQILREQQIENLKILKQQRIGQEISNDVARAEGDERIAEAKANLKIKGRHGSAPEGDGWIWNDEKNYYSRVDPETNTVEIVHPGTVRDDLIRSRIAQELNQSELVRFEKEFKEFETQIFKKYGDQIERERLNQAIQIVRNLALQGDLQKLDVDLFSKLGIGPNIIRSITSTAQAFAGQLNGLFQAGAMFAK